MVNINIINIIKNSISLYRKNWKAIGMPFYMMILISIISTISIMLAIIPFIGNFLFLIIGIILMFANLVLVFLALKPIYSALKNKAIPSWKSNIKETSIKTFIFYIINIFLSLAILLVSAILFAIVFVLLMIVATIILLIISYLLGLGKAISIFILIISTISTILLIVFFVAYMLAMLWVNFTKFEYIIKGKGIIDSIKSAVKLYKENFVTTIVFCLVLGIISFVISIIPAIIIFLLTYLVNIFYPVIITQIASVFSNILSSKDLGGILILKLIIGILSIISTAYSAILIYPWTTTAHVDFWDQLRNQSKNKIKNKKQIKTKD